MTAQIRLFVLAVAAVGVSCASATPYIPVIAQALSLAAEAAKQHGAELDKAPVTCEHEYDPKTQKLLFLCEADLSEAK